MICPSRMYGGFTGWPPTHVRARKFKIRAQNSSCDRGRRDTGC